MSSHHRDSMVRNESFRSRPAAAPPPLSPKESSLHRVCDAVGNSCIWTILIWVFTFVSLFGSPIQMLLVPKEGDRVFDVLFLTAAAFFVTDMILNGIVDHDYLVCGKKSPQQQRFASQSELADHSSGNPTTEGARTTSHNPSYYPTRKVCKFRVASFHFWCDLMSTVALLNDISFMNKSKYAMQEQTMGLDEYGIPMDLHEVHSKLPIELDIVLLVLVAKAARVARLIPSSTVVELTSSMNVYLYYVYERLSPMWYYKKYCDRRKKQENASDASRGKPRSSRPWHGFSIKLSKTKEEKKRKKKKEERSGRFEKIVGQAKQKSRPEGRYEDGSGFSNEVEDGKRGTCIARIGTNGKKFAGSKFRKNARADSQVGSAMAEVTGQWVATMLLLCLVVTSVFTYNEVDASCHSTMVVLHGQVINSGMETTERALFAAKNSSVPGLFRYTIESAATNETSVIFNFNIELHNIELNLEDLRDRDTMKIVVEDARGMTEGLFEKSKSKKQEAKVELFGTLFVLLVWFWGVSAFAGPVRTLVIVPMERMVHLLEMLMVDPLGYQSNLRFKKFMVEEEMLVKQSQWTKEVLKGMETSFLMSTILRIGSLMKVGFGSAGVEIIKRNLQQGQNKNMLILNSQGSTVSCIFLFCDIRQFTDATECLQEEVFVFTNKIAAVVHSICHSYGGSANKNIGDAFLVSWLLENDSNNTSTQFNRGSPGLLAKHNQADKALLSVVKICMALHYDDYYVETMSDGARTKLLTKLKNRPGPIVQMGFGLHAGKAVQGAIGSQRKIDATYVSEAVERAEFLESSTKQYGLRMLMSDSFTRLLHPSNLRRCRKIDQIMFHNEDEEDTEEMDYGQGDTMELFTFDMDVDALWRKRGTQRGVSGDASENASDNEESTRSQKLSASRTSNSSLRLSGNTSLRQLMMRGISETKRASATSAGSDDNKSHASDTGGAAAASHVVADTAAAAARSTFFEVDLHNENSEPAELVLPTGPTLYNANVWLQADMRRIRHQYTSVVFESFNSGLQRYYDKDWNGARQCFESILERFEDGPSRYFINQMTKDGWKPPKDFQAYGKA